MKHLRYQLLATTLLMSVDVSAAAQASDGEATLALSSPVRSGTVEVVKPTPGERIALKQREIFKKERFIAVFGEAAIEELGINWETLGDVKLSFEYPDKRHETHRIKKFMKVQARYHSGNEAFERLNYALSTVLTAQDAVHLDRLEDHARVYFQSKFPGATIKFFPKLDGVQLGSIVCVEQAEGGVKKFYIKTHSDGQASERSSTAGSLNPIELLVYKILQEFGVGCETHFFGRDERNFYIATKDANSEGKFVEYSKVDRKNKATTAPVWGGLSTILVADDRENEINWAAVEEVIATDSLAQSFIHKMSMLDALARLMVLTDLQTNGSNFGFIYNESGLPMLKVIDFRLAEVSRAEEYEFTDSRFGGFLRGNGFFRYATADEAVCYALRNRPKDLRVAEALRVFETQLLGWEEKIERSKTETIDALIAVELERVELEKLIRELEHHADILKANFGMFERLLRSYQ
ncbi:MAG: hypothetical protein Q8Q56_03615 [Alphaproteobacteria bacterium]|nr:hypothetical protein [Alphaproteobacteria bacterium]